MKRARIMLLCAFVLIIGAFLFFFGNLSGASAMLPQASRAIRPSSYVTLSGGSGMQPVGNLVVLDQSGTQDNPAAYVTFTTPGASIYKGYRSYYLPADVLRGSISSMAVRANFKGPVSTRQTWTWYLYDWSTRSWVSIGYNARTSSTQWKLLTFSAPNPRRFVNATTLEIRLLLRSNNPGGNAKLDYEAITFGYSATPTPTSVRFAVIGDYGSGNSDEAAVAALVKSWKPDFIVTTGDNNYPAGESATIDQNIGQYYHDYIRPYAGSYGTGSPDVNRFFPAIGNHDWDSTGGVQPYLDYFRLPGNERYYDFRQGPVHFFILDSDPREPDGVTSSSTQAVWLQNRLASASEPWKLVIMHHPPYSSSSVHGSSLYMQWDFQGWGASAVLTGHDHTYERLDEAGFPYIVDGLGGQSTYDFGTPLAGSQVRYNAQHGAVLVDASAAQISLRFIGVDGSVVDSLVLP